MRPQMIDRNELSNLIIKYRRDLHQIPELGFLVYDTSAYVKNVLSQMDCQVESIVKTGLTAYFDFGHDQTVVFRADMDGLPINEESGADYASRHSGCMHACGHDGHMAIMLGFAHYVDDCRKSGGRLPFNVLLLFQPAEETIGGALKIMDTDLFEHYHARSIFGLHLWPNLSKGEIVTKPGPMMAKSTAVSIDFEGLSAHCGEPEKGKDALAAACRFVTDIYSYKELHVRERSILKFGKMVSGNVRNAISPYTHLDGTMRTFYDTTWLRLVSAMRTLSDEIYESYGVKVTVDVSKSHPAVNNSAELYERIKPGLSHLNFVELRKPVMIAEDFSFFEQKIPGVFFFLGTGSGVPLHSDNFDFDDSVLIDGVDLFATLIKNAGKSTSVTE